jgi:hypothetical protein
MPSANLPAVRRGRTLLAVQADEAAWAKVAQVIERHAPIEIEEVTAAE